MSELKGKKPMPTRIWVQSKRTINTGNYESASFDAGMEVSVPEGVDLEKVYAHAYKTCEKEVIKAAIAAGVVNG